MLIEFPILTYIVLLPAVGAVFTYLTGSDRTARAVALAFSFVVLGLCTVLLMGFLWPNVISLPTMTTAGNHTYFAVEETPWVPSLHINYVMGADELSVVLVFLNALLTPLALAISWDEHHRVPVRHACHHRDDPDSRGHDRGPDVRRAAHRLRNETPDVAVAHVAARRPRRSAHRRFRHLGRRPPEARRIRADPVQRPDDPAGRDGHVLAARHRRRGLRLHDQRPRRGPRPHRRDLPDVRPRTRVGGPVHGRGLARPHARHAEHLGVGRDRETGAAHGDVHDDLVHGVPRPPRTRRVRRGVQRVPRRLCGVRAARLRPDPDRHPDGGVLHLGDAARDLRTAESEMGGDAGPAPVRGRPPRGPRGSVRGLRDRPGPLPVPDLELGPGDPRGPLTCRATASSCRRRSSSRPRWRPRSSGSHGGSGPTCCGPSPSSARASRSSSR